MSAPTDTLLRDEELQVLLEGPPEPNDRDALRVSPARLQESSRQNFRFHGTALGQNFGSWTPHVQPEHQRKVVVPKLPLDKVPQAHQPQRVTPAPQARPIPMHEQLTQKLKAAGTRATNAHSPQNIANLTPKAAFGIAAPSPKSGLLAPISVLQAMAEKELAKTADVGSARGTPVGSPKVMSPQPTGSTKMLWDGVETAPATGGALARQSSKMAMGLSRQGSRSTMIRQNSKQMLRTNSSQLLRGTPRQLLRRGTSRSSLNVNQLSSTGHSVYSRQLSTQSLIQVLPHQIMRITVAIKLQRVWRGHMGRKRTFAKMPQELGLSYLQLTSTKRQYFHTHAIYSVLKSNLLFQEEMTTEQALMACRVATRQKFIKHESIVKKQEWIDCCWIILEGSLDHYQLSETGMWESYVETRPAGTWAGVAPSFLNEKGFVKTRGSIKVSADVSSAVVVEMPFCFGFNSKRMQRSLEYAKFLGEIPAFKQCKNSSLVCEQFARLLSNRRVESGAAVVHAGEHPEGMYFVYGGEATTLLPMAATNSKGAGEHNDHGDSDEDDTVMNASASGHGHGGAGSLTHRPGAHRSSKTQSSKNLSKGLRSTSHGALSVGNDGAGERKNKRGSKTERLSEETLEKMRSSMLNRMAEQRAAMHAGLDRLGNDAGELEVAAGHTLATTGALDANDAVKLPRALPVGLMKHMHSQLHGQWQQTSTRKFVSSLSKYKYFGVAEIFQDKPFAYDVHAGAGSLVLLFISRSALLRVAPRELHAAIEEESETAGKWLRDRKKGLVRGKPKTPKRKERFSWRIESEVTQGDEARAPPSMYIATRLPSTFKPKRVSGISEILATATKPLKAKLNKRAEREFMLMQRREQYQEGLASASSRDDSFVGASQKETARGPGADKTAGPTMWPNTPLEKGDTSQKNIMKMIASMGKISEDGSNQGGSSEGGSDNGERHRGEVKSKKRDKKGLMAKIPVDILKTMPEYWMGGTVRVPRYHWGHKQESTEDWDCTVGADGQLMDDETVRSTLRDVKALLKLRGTAGEVPVEDKVRAQALADRFRNSTHGAHVSEEAFQGIADERQVRRSIGIGAMTGRFSGKIQMSSLSLPTPTCDIYEPASVKPWFGDQFGANREGVDADSYEDADDEIAKDARERQAAMLALDPPRAPVPCGGIRSAALFKQIVAVGSGPNREERDRARLEAAASASASASPGLRGPSPRLRKIGGVPRVKAMLERQLAEDTTEWGPPNDMADDMSNAGGAGISPLPFNVVEAADRALGLHSNLNPKVHRSISEVSAFRPVGGAPKLQLSKAQQRVNANNTKPQTKPQPHPPTQPSPWSASDVASMDGVHMDDFLASAMRSGNRGRQYKGDLIDMQRIAEESAAGGGAGYGAATMPIVSPVRDSLAVVSHTVVPTPHRPVARTPHHRDVGPIVGTIGSSDGGGAASPAVLSSRTPMRAIDDVTSHPVDEEGSSTPRKLPPPPLESVQAESLRDIDPKAEEWKKEWIATTAAPPKPAAGQGMAKLLSGAASHGGAAKRHSPRPPAPVGPAAVAGAGGGANSETGLSAREVLGPGKPTGIRRGLSKLLPLEERPSASANVDDGGADEGQDANHGRHGNVTSEGHVSAPVSSAAGPVGGVELYPHEPARRPPDAPRRPNALERSGMLRIDGIVPVVDKRPVLDFMRLVLDPVRTGVAYYEGWVLPDPLAARVAFVSVGAPKDAERLIGRIRSKLEFYGLEVTESDAEELVDITAQLKGDFYSGGKGDAPPPSMYGPKVIAK